MRKLAAAERILNNRMVRVSVTAEKVDFCGADRALPARGDARVQRGSIRP
ncbi:hypothetical protein [Sinorhizobium terangae]|uniref:Uncharacterized protein n=1 Tax=Sinorhizobium terangae TaxID=110322 RepID=A0A6N7LD06_SINTE|nr:hypothetical protein [Sinorhizobium terangae]MBB4188610.1 hypothetical protein [Sinorhizobium terangae]MQX14584.1 hypothetical protein [Sinorhizobium terangae]WFU49829.1 hypothetical protein QA637_23730 [Sinorhizobium terangae]